LQTEFEFADVFLIAVESGFYFGLVLDAAEGAKLDLVGILETLFELVDLFEELVFVGYEGKILLGELVEALKEALFLSVLDKDFVLELNFQLKTFTL
jgi:hypothetical protein